MGDSIGAWAAGTTVRTALLEKVTKAYRTAWAGIPAYAFDLQALIEEGILY